VAGITESRRQVKFIQHGNYNENLALFDIDLLKELFEIYKSSIEEDIKDKNELNYNLALLYKHEGAVYGKIYREEAYSLNRNSIDSLFSLAINHYSKLPKEFLNTSVEVYIQQNLDEMEKRVMKRSHLFLYPDHFKIGESFTYAGFFRYYGADFFNYMIKHRLFNKYYQDQDDYKLLITWVSSYFEMYSILSGTGYFNRAALNYPSISQGTLISLDSIIVRSGYSDFLDEAWINLKLANDYFEAGDTLSAFERVKRVKFLEFNKLYPTEDGPFHNMLFTVTKQLSIHGKRNEAMAIVGQFSNSKNKILGYSRLAAFTKMNGFDKESEIYKDSTLTDLERVRFFRNNNGYMGYDFRTGLVELLTLQNNRKSDKQARQLISNMDFDEKQNFDAKLNGVLAGVRTLARMDKYYNAWSSVPELANPEDRLRCILAILYVEVQKRPQGDDNTWAKFDKNLLGWIDYTDFLYDLFEY
jgi:hypothetical protein